MENISVGSKYIDMSGKYSLVIIVEKTPSSVRFKDTKGFYSWIHIHDFIRSGSKYEKRFILKNN